MYLWRRWSATDGPQRVTAADYHVVLLMVLVMVTVTVTAPEVEAPRDLPHARRDHLGGAPAQVLELNGTNLQSLRIPPQNEADLF